jgi:hypothetical protein
MNATTDLAPVRRVNGEPPDADSGPRDLYRHATDVAGVCGEIVKQTARSISGRKYVCVEGWQAITTAHGCALSIEEVKEDADGNVEAIASVRRMSDGVILAKAEGFVGMDEPRWAKCPRYARRAMAQTRAMSRAARSVFSHVVILIDKGLATTPAEEIDGTETTPTQFGGRRPTMTDVAEAAAPVEEEHAEPDELEDDSKFVAILDELLESRGFKPSEAEAAKFAAAKMKKKPDVFKLDLGERHALLDAVNRGVFDKAKVPAKA